MGQMSRMSRAVRLIEVLTPLLAASVEDRAGQSLRVQATGLGCSDYDSCVRLYHTLEDPDGDTLEVCEESILFDPEEWRATDLYEVLIDRFDLDHADVVKALTEAKLFEPAEIEALRKP